MVPTQIGTRRQLDPRGRARRPRRRRIRADGTRGVHAPWTGPSRRRRSRSTQLGPRRPPDRTEVPGASRCNGVQARHIASPRTELRRGRPNSPRRSFHVGCYPDDEDNPSISAEDWTTWRPAGRPETIMAGLARFLWLLDSRQAWPPRSATDAPAVGGSQSAFAAGCQPAPISPTCADRPVRPGDAVWRFSPAQPLRVVASGQPAAAQRAGVDAGRPILVRARRCVAGRRWPTPTPEARARGAGWIPPTSPSTSAALCADAAAAPMPGPSVRPAQLSGRLGPRQCSVRREQPPRRFA